MQTRREIVLQTGHYALRDLMWRPMYDTSWS